MTGLLNANSSKGLPSDWAGAKVLIEKINRNSISLARLLMKLGAQVRLVDRSPQVAPSIAVAPPTYERHSTVEAYLTEAIAAEDWEECRSLAGQGVRVQIGWEWQADPFDFDLVFVDLYPPPTRPFIVEARRRGKLVTILPDLVCQLSPAPVIGVTGTAGKSSTTALIESILALAGRTTYIGWDNVAQNPWINYEVLDRLEAMRPSGWVVAELTSSHLEYMHASPDIAVVTNLSPDHLEWHGGLPAYYAAKAAILRFQSAGQWAVLNHDDLTRSILAPHCRGRVAYFSLTEPVSAGVFLAGEQVVARWDDHEYFIANLQEISLRRPYLSNGLAAAAAALAAGVAPESIRQALLGFRALERRFELLGEIGGVPVIDDSMANTPQKAAASFEAFSDASLVLIAGGWMRTAWSDCLHGTPEGIAQVEAACRRAAQKASAVVLFGEAAPVLKPHLIAAGLSPEQIGEVPSLDQSLPAALSRARAGDTILWSPIFYVHPHESAHFSSLFSSSQSPTHSPAPASFGEPP